MLIPGLGSCLEQAGGGGRFFSAQLTSGQSWLEEGQVSLMIREAECQADAQYDQYTWNAALTR